MVKKPEIGLTQVNTLTSKPSSAPNSCYHIIRELSWKDSKKCRIVLYVFEAENTDMMLSARVIVTASDGSHPDGSGHGTYDDGRFFADGQFAVTVPPGQTGIAVSSGPCHIPVEVSVEAKAGREIHVRTELCKWFSTEERNWYCGDNHVHEQHDDTAVVKTGIDYTALQARANGLNYVTEADGVSTNRELTRFSAPNFFIKSATEVRGGVFAGHLNTPGIRHSIRSKVSQAGKNVLPLEQIVRIVHKANGVAIYTHPLPLPGLHWMGATESLSDAVIGKCADAFDIESSAEEMLWYTILNMGQRVAASASTDSALGRLHTLSPGDRRIYSYATEFEPDTIIDAIRRGRTFATNGGSVFPFFTIDGHIVGDSIMVNNKHWHKARIEVYSLFPLRRVEIIRKGITVKTFKISTSSGKRRIYDYDLRETGPCWYIARVEDITGKWAITSPIYFIDPLKGKQPFSASICLQIGNFTRFTSLSRSFYAHILLTISQGSLRNVTLLKDGAIVKEFRTDAGNHIISDRLPVTERDGDYTEGWVWHPSAKAPMHFQADYPVKESGWYYVRATLEDCTDLTSEAIYFDASCQKSQQISFAVLFNGKDSLRLRGCGEEMPLKDIREPFEGDHWWYPMRSYWEVEAHFAGHAHNLSKGYPPAIEKFRSLP